MFSVCAFFDRTVKMTIFLCVFFMLLQFNGIIYKCEMLHYQIFHPLNQADLPAMLDKYRIGGRRLDLEDDSTQSVNF
jgi:hypothetical protein